MLNVMLAQPFNTNFCAAKLLGNSAKKSYVVTRVRNVSLNSAMVPGRNKSYYICLVYIKRYK